MLDLFILFILSFLSVYGALRLIFGSAIFGFYRNVVNGRRDYYWSKKRFFRYAFYYMLQCWQCFGFWTSAAVVGSLGLSTGVFVFDIASLVKYIVLVLATSVSTDVIAEYVPLTEAHFEPFSDIVESEDQSQE